MTNTQKLFSDPDNPNEGVGQFCHDLASRLFPICRSLTGDGNRQTLDIISEYLPDISRHTTATGNKAFDWDVPNEWVVRGAYIEKCDGQRIVDFADNNLHLMGYSTPVNEKLSLDELQPHLYSLPEQPDAIPYITSYYSRNWGFCLTHNQRKTLKPGDYSVVIDTELKPGKLDYADLIIPGDSSEEIFLSTYICHPSMANNELSGPVVAIALALWLQSLAQRKYTYRFVFIPETIGSLIYLSRNLEQMKANTIAGFNLTCMGDNNAYSYLPSRNGNTIADRIAKHVLSHRDPDYDTYTWLDRGSDERQYCAPGIDLPVATMMRSKYGIFPEYHTSLDNLEFVTPAGLEGGFAAVREALFILENNATPKVRVLGEPQLGKRGLYPNVSTKEANNHVRVMMSAISYCDGKHTLLDIAELLDIPFARLLVILAPLMEHNLLETTA